CERDARWAVGVSMIGYPFVVIALILPYTQIFAERYFYIPLCGSSLLLALGIDAIRSRGLFQETWERIAVFAPAAALSAFLWIVSLTYISVWTTEDDLLAYAMQNPPYSYEVAYDLGVNRVEQGDLGGAVKMFQNSLALMPGYDRAANNLGVMYLRMGRYKSA